MTTSVKVQACCPASIEVHVDVAEHGKHETTILQNGEEREFYVYGNKTIFVAEVPK